VGYYKKHKGDYYRGDYYRGDLWDDITSGVGGFVQGLGTAATQVKNVWGSLFPPELGGTKGQRALPAALDATAPGSTGVALAPNILPTLRVPVSPVNPVSSSAAAPIMRALRAARPTSGSTHTAFRHVDSWEVRDRRVMNPLNPHALRRAIRRGRAFQKFAMKQLRLEGVHRKVKGFKHKVGKR
jgi:hypothetical protein